MRIVLAGRPGAGKSTLFDLVAGRDAAPAARGAGLRIAHVPVPDARLQELSVAFKPKKTTPARLEFQDLEQKAGPNYPALSPERREAVTKAELLLLVVELWGDPPDAWTDLAREQWQELREEFLLLDLATIEKRLEKVEKLVKVGQKPAFTGEPELLSQLKTLLESGRPISDRALTVEEDHGLRGYGLLSGSKILPAFNVNEQHLDQAPAWAASVSTHSGQPGFEWLGQERLVFSAEVERQIQELPPEEQASFAEAFGLTEPAVNQVIRAAYRLAGLHCFFTAGDDEVRGWTVRQGSTAPECAGAIHTDLEKGFVRAEVLAFDDWKRLGSLHAAREQGVLRLEGKEYVVKDGDILNIRSGLAKSRG
ncbi:MAG: DUF933 domain-containing protein [Candidatus Eisenbacteria bacterium]